MAPPEANNPEEPKGSDPNLTESGKTGDEGKQENFTRASDDKDEEQETPPLNPDEKD